MKPYYEDVSAGITIYHGKAEDVLPALAGEFTIVTDPPYGIDLQPQRGVTQAIANDRREPAKALWREVVPLLLPLASKNTAHMFFGVWSEVWAKDVLADSFDVKNCIVWVKNVWGLGYYLRPQHEFIWYCHNGEPVVPEKAKSNVWQYDRVNDPAHSCQKPVELIRDAIEYAGGGISCA